MDIGAWEYVPVVGDVYDLGEGGAKIYGGVKNGDWGQVAKGVGQMGMGAFGLGTLGVGSIGKSVAKGIIKGGGKYIAKHGARKAMNKATQEAAIKGGANPLLTRAKAYFANKPYEKAVKLAERNKVLQNFVDTYPFFGKAALKPYALVEASRGIGNWLLGEPSNKTGVDVTKGNGSNNEVGNRGAVGGGSGGGYSLSSGGVSGLTPEQQAELLKQLAQGGNPYGDNYSDYGRDMINRYLINQSMMEPYRKNLQNYIKDYDTRADLAYNQDRELAALAGLTGNNAYAQMMGKNNALVNEANRLGAIKTAGEDLKTAGEGLDTLLGNMDLARTTGLPLSAANADNKMADLAIRKMIADDKNVNRLEVEQYKGQMKLQYAQLQARLRAQLKAGDRAGATNTYKQLNAFKNVLGMIDKYGITADDVYRNTGVRFSIPENVGQVGDVKI